jgi:hypothetical protein
MASEPEPGCARSLAGRKESLVEERRSRCVSCAGARPPGGS